MTADRRRQARAARLTFALLGLAPILSAGAPAAAHELGTVQVGVRFAPDFTYRVDVTFDTEHLPPAWRPEAGGPLAGTGDAARVHARFLQAYVDSTTIAFDGRAVRPRVEILPGDRGESAIRLPPGAPPPAFVLRFQGPVPGGARSFTWSNALDLGSYPLAIRRGAGEGADAGAEQTSWQWIASGLTGGATSEPYELAAELSLPRRSRVAWQYLVLGFTHILPKGLDHILFVLGIFLLSVRLRPMIWQVSAFTVAHTITLALTIYGVVSLPSSIVEPLIALSIVYVAIENVVVRRLHPWRVALVFCFGLLHGMGFAGVLSELGLPRSEFLTALLCFNLGVELGQLTVIGLALLAVGRFRDRPWYRRRVVIPASLVIAAVGLYWAIERTF